MKKMSMFYPLVSSMYMHMWLNTDVTVCLVLHPYYKLMYIEMAWGGAEEQKNER